MPGSDSGKSVDIREIASVIFKRKWLLILPVLIVTACAFGATYLLVPKYRSSAIIWIDQPTNVSAELIGIIGVGGVSNRRGAAGRRLATLNYEITSRLYLDQLIRELNLDKDADIARQAAKLRGNNPALSLEQLKFNLLSDKLRKLVSMSAAGPDHIKLTVQSIDPVLARDMVTKLTEILEREKDKYEMERILDNQNFADLQLRKTEHDYKVALDSLTSARQRLTQMQLPENIASDINRSEVVSDIDKNKLEITGYRSDLDKVTKDLKEFDLDRARLQYTNRMVELRATIDGQLSTYVAMMQTYAWNEQNVVNVNIRVSDNIRFLEDEVRLAIENQFSAYPANQRTLLARSYIIKENIDILNSKVSQLEQARKRIDDRVNQLPAIQAEIADLSLIAENERRYRDAFRSEGATVEILSQRSKDRTRYRIVEPARIPLTPFWPDRNKVVLLGLVLGVMLGMGAILLVELLDHSFRRIDDIEDTLGLKVLATIPRIDQLKGVR